MATRLIWGMFIPKASTFKHHRPNPFSLLAATLVSLGPNPDVIHRLQRQREICLQLGLSLGGLGLELCRNDVRLMLKSEEPSWGLQISVNWASKPLCEPGRKTRPPNVRNLLSGEHCWKHDILHELCQTCVRQPADILTTSR